MKTKRQKRTPKQTTTKRNSTSAKNRSSKGCVKTSKEKATGKKKRINKSTCTSTLGPVKLKQYELRSKNPMKESSENTESNLCKSKLKITKKVKSNAKSNKATATASVKPNTSQFLSSPFVLEQQNKTSNSTFTATSNQCSMFQAFANAFSAPAPTLFSSLLNSSVFSGIMTNSSNNSQAIPLTFNATSTTGTLSNSTNQSKIFPSVFQQTPLRRGRSKSKAFGNSLGNAFPTLLNTPPTTTFSSSMPLSGPLVSNSLINSSGFSGITASLSSQPVPFNFNATPTTGTVPNFTNQSNIFPSGFQQTPLRRGRSKSKALGNSLKTVFPSPFNTLQTYSPGPAVGEIMTSSSSSCNSSVAPPSLLSPFQGSILHPVTSSRHTTVRKFAVDEEFVPKKVRKKQDSTKKKISKQGTAPKTVVKEQSSKSKKKEIAMTKATSVTSKRRNKSKVAKKTGKITNKTTSKLKAIGKPSTRKTHKTKGTMKAPAQVLQPLGLGSAGLQPIQPLGFGSAGLQPIQPQGLGSAGLQPMKPLGLGSAGLQPIQPLGFGSAGLQPMKPLGLGSAGLQLIPPMGLASAGLKSTHPMTMGSATPVLGSHFPASKLQSIQPLGPPSGMQPIQPLGSTSGLWPFGPPSRIQPMTVSRFHPIPLGPGPSVPIIPPGVSGPNLAIPALAPTNTAPAANSRDKKKLSDKAKKTFANLHMKVMVHKLNVDDLTGLTANDLKLALKYNDRSTTGNKKELSKQIIDFMTNGCPPRCPECGGGRLRVKEGDNKEELYCPGYMEDDEFIDCAFKSENVVRIPWKSPQ